MERELMAAVWLIVALLCFIIKILSPPAWWATITGCMAGLIGIVYFLSSIISVKTKEINHDDREKFDGGEEDE